MLGGSLASLRECTKHLDRVIGTDAALARELSSVLFAVLDALDASPALTRALANPNRAPAGRERLVRQMLAGFPAEAADLVVNVCRSRWSQDQDLRDAIEMLGLDAALAECEHLGILAQVEAELFEVDMLLVGNRPLRTALGDVMAPSAAKGALAGQVFASVIVPQTLNLIQRLVTHPRGRGVRYSLKVLGDLIAARRRRLVAVVITASPLSQAQIDKLGAVLTEEYGRPIQVNLAVDNSVVGGLRIRVGDDVMDGTVIARFAHLRRAMAA